MKRVQIYGAILGVLLSLAFSCHSAVAESTLPQASEYIAAASASLKPAGYGFVRADFQITGTFVMRQLGAAEIQIEEQTGNSWTTVRTYRYENYPSLVGNNVLRHTGGITFPVVAGRTYRARIIFYAANAGGSEKQEFTTFPITAY